MDASKGCTVFIFHRDKYIIDSLAKALGYTQSDYLPCYSPDEIIARLKENHASLFLISGDFPEDLKTILDEVFGGIKANRTPVLIFSVSNQGSLIHANKSGFKEIQDCFDSKLVDVIQIPFIKISEIKNKIEDLKSAYQNNHKISEEIRKKVAERIAEQQEVSQRHINKNLQAAERILNGALLSGDYDLLDPNIERRAIDCYKRLISAQPLDYDKETKEALKTIDRAKIALESRPNEEWHKDIKRILIIDDQKEMWEPVWKFILGNNKVVIVEDSEKGLGRIREGVQYDCVLLDIDLGKDENGNDKENGIVVLQRIKYEQFDLPVIMMTACDHAELTKMCLRYGADSYFVKTLRDDRESVEYYKRIRDIIDGIPLYDDPERGIWQEYVKYESAIDEIDKKHGTEIGKYFKKAYYLLTIDDAHFLLARLLIPEWLQKDDDNERKTAKYDGVAFNAILTADQICIAKLLMYGGCKTYEEADNLLYKKKLDGNHPNLEERLSTSEIGIQPKMVCTLLSLAGVRHAFTSTFQITLNKNSAVKCMTELLCLIKKSNLLRVESILKRNPEITNVDIKKYLQIEQSSSSSHENISKQGAICFSNALSRIKNRIKKYSKLHTVLFIDDEGENSAWYKPLQEFFKLKNSNLEVCKSYDENIDLNKYSLILLDLVFYGKHEKGLDYLRAIRKINVSIPIVILTADNSAYFARRCMFNGADDYFVKETVDKDIEYLINFEEIVDFFINNLEITKQREYWHFLNKLKNNVFGLSDSSIEEIRKAKALPKDNFKEKLRQLISFPMREGYFYYLLEIKKIKLLNQSRTKKLLSIDNNFEHYKNDVFSCFGQFVECLIEIKKIIKEYKGKESIGFLITRKNPLNMPEFQRQFFMKLWQLRISAKTGKKIDEDISILIHNLINILDNFQFICCNDNSEIDKTDSSYYNRYFRVGMKVEGLVIDTFPDTRGKNTARVEIIKPSFGDGFFYNAIGIEKGEIKSFYVLEINIREGKHSLALSENYVNRNWKIRK